MMPLISIITIRKPTKQGITRGLFPLMVFLVFRSCVFNIPAVLFVSADSLRQANPVWTSTEVIKTALILNI